MGETFQKKSSGILATLFIGLIIVSFLFTGLDGLRRRPNVVATVAGEDIGQQELLQGIQNYTNFLMRFTGSRGEISSFLVNNVLARLTEQKLMGHFSKELGLLAAEEEVANTIKAQFAQNPDIKFGPELYKALLSRSGLSPEEYERSVSSQILESKVAQIIDLLPTSKSQENLLNSIESEKLEVSFFQLNRQKLTDFVQVKKEELDQFLSEEKNLKTIKHLFEQDSSQEKSPKKKLNFEQYKVTKGKELLQKDLVDRRKSLEKSVATQVKNALRAGEEKTLQSLKKKYNSQYKQSEAISIFSSRIGQSQLDNQLVKKLFNSKSVGQIEESSSALHLDFVLAKKFYREEEKETSSKKEDTPKRPSQNRNLSLKTREDLVNYLKTKVKVKTNTDLINNTDWGQYFQ